MRNDTSGAQNRVGALFFALCLLAFTSVTAVDLVQAEAGPAGREMSAKYYTPAAYAATKLVLDGLLLRALPAVLFGLPFYFLMGLSPEPRAVVTFLFVIVTFSAAVGAAALAAAAALDSPGKTILVMNMVRVGWCLYVCLLYVYLCVFNLYLSIYLSERGYGSGEQQAHAKQHLWWQPHTCACACT